MSLAKRKVQNPAGKAWIAGELEMRKDAAGSGRTGTGRGGGRRQRIDPEKLAKIKKGGFARFARRTG